MAYTSPTTVNVTEGFGSFFPFISEVTNFWFGRMLMIGIFVIFLVGLIRSNKDDFFGAFAVASYVTFVIGLLFWVIGLVSGLDFALIIGLSAVSSILLFVKHRVQ